MRYEVDIVQGSGHDETNCIRKPEVVAEEIANVYSRVALSGGKIVAAHTLEHIPVAIKGYTNWPPEKSVPSGTNFLYLVAELPESTEAPN